MEKTLLSKLPDIISKSFVSAVEELIEIQKDALLTESSIKLSKVILELSSSFIPELGIRILKSLIEEIDDIKQIKASVSLMIKEPILTAMEQIKISCQIHPTNLVEKNYKTNRLKEALLNLDRASSLTTQEEDLHYINLLRGIVAFEIPGGNSEATFHFKNYLNSSASVIHQMELKRKMLTTKIAQFQSKADKIKTQGGIGAGGGMLGMSKAQDYIKKEEYMNRVSQNSANLQNLKEQIEKELLTKKATETILATLEK